MPFVGLGLLTITLTDLMDLPSSLIWLLLLLPGPLYVHLSWAPRWRLLCLLEDDQNPFEGLAIPDSEPMRNAEEIADGDSELLSVVDGLEEE